MAALWLQNSFGAEEALISDVCRYSSSSSMRRPCMSILLVRSSSSKLASGATAQTEIRSCKTYERSM